ncbi:hypothetical protein RND81_11G105400 [Saponaria officinalis]|uniref:Protein NUCLEAR FUSION DEFECTIVE 6, chloroplastic/mitochondrial-like n=1 Tax=Saponaria officinalis TaxID=3572 RepID=A0AAW1HK86_SAPOF
MATLSAARSIFRSTSARTAAEKFTSAAKSSSSRFTTANHLLSSRRIFRCPVELSACIETMQPFHTATASAVMTTTLSITRFSHAWIIDDL